jgi:hypothetical protein
MRRIDLGNTITGEIVHKGVPYTAGKERFVKDIRGDDTAEITIPIEELEDHLKDYKESFLLKGRFIMAYDDAHENPITFAGMITKIRENDKKTITISASSMKTTFKGIPAVQAENRTRIASDALVWDITGSPSTIMRTILSEVTDDSDGFPTIKSVALPPVVTGNYNKVINLYEVPSVGEIMDSFMDDYEGVEMVFVPEYTNASQTHVQWVLQVGTVEQPHINKHFSPFQVNLDADDGNLSFESITDGTGSNNSNWTFYQSARTSEIEGEEAWIDLKADRKQPTNPLLWMFYSKERADVPLTEEQLNEQIAARLNVSDIDIKTFNVTQFDQGHTYVQNLGRLIHFTGSNRITNLDETIRIVQVTWSLSSEKVEIIVQPKDYRVYPKLPKPINGGNNNGNNNGNLPGSDTDWTKPVTGIGMPGFGGGDGGETFSYNAKLLNEKSLQFVTTDSRITRVFWIGLTYLDAAGEPYSWETNEYGNTVDLTIPPGRPGDKSGIDVPPFGGNFPEKFRIVARWFDSTMPASNMWKEKEFDLSWSDFLMPGGGNFPGGGGFPGSGGTPTLPPFTLPDPIGTADPIFQKTGVPTRLESTIYGPTMTQWKNYVYGLNKPGWLLMNESNAGKWNNGLSYEPGNIEVRRVTLNDDGSIDPDVKIVATIKPSDYALSRLPDGDEPSQHGLYVGSFVVNGTITVYFMEYKKFGYREEGNSLVKSWAMENTLDEQGFVNGVWRGNGSSFTVPEWLTIPFASTEVFTWGKNLVPYGPNLDKMAVVGGWGYPENYTWKYESGGFLKTAMDRIYAQKVLTKDFSNSNMDTPWNEDSVIPFTQKSDKEGKLDEADMVGAGYHNGFIYAVNLSHTAEKSDTVYRCAAQGIKLGPWEKVGSVNVTEIFRESPAAFSQMGVGFAGEYFFWNAGTVGENKDPEDFPWINFNYGKIGFTDIVKEGITTGSNTTAEVNGFTGIGSDSPDFFNTGLPPEASFYSDPIGGGMILGAVTGFQSKFFTWNKNVFVFEGYPQRPNSGSSRGTTGVCIKLINP